MQQQPRRAAHAARHRLQLPPLDVEAAALHVQLPGGRIAGGHVNVQVRHAGSPGVTRGAGDEGCGNPLRADSSLSSSQLSIPQIPSLGGQDEPIAVLISEH